MKVLSIQGQLSGSMAGVTASHNKGGQYFRRRAVPVNPNSVKQQAIRTALGNLSSGWAALTGAQKTGWNSWAAANPTVDPLGQTIQLSGQQAYIGLNSRLRYVGAAAVATAPVAMAPSNVTISALVYNTTPQVIVTFTPTPLPTGTRLWVFSSIPSIGGRNPNFNQARFVGASAAAAASPVTLAAPYGGVAGWTANVYVAVMGPDGQISAYQRVTQALT